MPTSTVIYDDALVTITQVTSDLDPKSPGGWTTLQMLDKAGSPNANRATLQQQAQAALAANRADQTQDGTIQSGAATINATAGTFTLGQCTTFIKQLSTAVSTLAGNDVNAKKELNALIRLVLAQFDATN